MGGFPHVSLKDRPYWDYQCSPVYRLAIRMSSENALSAGELVE